MDAVNAVEKQRISTHTPLAGRDRCLSNLGTEIPISTHTPLAGRDTLRLEKSAQRSRFLLTRPSRGATWNRRKHRLNSIISTHTPLAGRDLPVFGFVTAVNNFYSHAPRGARHEQRGGRVLTGSISTHTPLAGRDFCGVVDNRAASDFYSHAPRGARPDCMLLTVFPIKFLLTRPSRGATQLIYRGV